jgi:glucan phosphoethanolaminetransferase (alkaline phosphatase superfamily)
MICLLIAAAWTVGAKLMAVRRHDPGNVWVAWADVALWDVVFFASVILLFSLLYTYRPAPLFARGGLLVAVLVLLWGVANSAWLMATGVQLQPGILAALGHAPMEFWPIVKTHLMRNLHYAIPIIVTLLAAGVWFVWRLVHPVRVVASQRYHIRRAVVVTGLLFVSLLTQRLCHARSGMGFAGEVLGFSSHWYALVSVVNGGSRHPRALTQSRDLPRAGERQIVPPGGAADGLPNVALVLLESVPWTVTSLADAQQQTTPNLLQVASEGTEFVLTRVPVPHTTKAFWSVLTGTTPDVQPDAAEAVLMDEPYEALPSILARSGYRSAFFEMSKGTFECAPGFFSNLGFRWAWFRENLEDPSANLGYFGGDDCKMIEPMFRWVERGSQPFFLMMITSAAHDPYEVPEWFGEARQNPYENYLQAVRYTDYFLGRFCEQLRERGLEENTILCVLGDHGETFREHSRTTRWAPYEELIRVPWVVRWAGRVERGARVEWPCSQLDVAPTLLNLIGFDVSDAGFEGKDAFEPSPADRRLFYASWLADSPFGFVEGHRKWVYWPYTDAVFVYDLLIDPDEESPVAVVGREKDRIVDELVRWRLSSHFVIPAKRFRKRLVFDHWQTFSSGRSAWAYYVP